MIHVTLSALSPIAHGSFGHSVGNALLFRRLPVVSLPSRPKIPAVSGNSLRGILRRVVMREVLDVAGLTKMSPGWDHIYAALVNGGHLQGAGATSLDPQKIAELRKALPPLSMFGAALRSWMLEGRMDVGICWPQCRETLDAGLVSAAADIAAEDLIHEYSHVRHIERTEQNPDVTGVTPMPTTMEVLATGTVLETAIRPRSNATKIEVGAIAHGLNKLSTIGAKSSAGLGHVRIEHDGDASPYLSWLEALTSEPLAELAAQLMPSAAPRKEARNAPAAATAS